jgi:tRNA(fMet)-specific endonuclease VapC
VILDTNALSAFADDEAHVTAILDRSALMAIPVVVLGEFGFGMAQSRKRERYERWLEELLPLSRILEITRETVDHYTAVRLELKRIGKPIPANDVWIAALCRQHRLPLLSRDRHFDVIRDIQRIGW